MVTMMKEKMGTGMEWKARRDREHTEHMRKELRCRRPQQAHFQMVGMSDCGGERAKKRKRMRERDTHREEEMGTMRKMRTQRR